MALVSSLYLNWNQSYNQNCGFDLCYDPDSDLDPIGLQNNRCLGVTHTDIPVQYLRDPLKTVTARALTDRQTYIQTDRQTYKHIDQHTFENESFRK